MEPSTLRLAGRGTRKHSTKQMQWKWNRSKILTSIICLHPQIEMHLRSMRKPWSAPISSFLCGYRMEDSRISLSMGKRFSMAKKGLMSLSLPTRLFIHSSWNKLANAMRSMILIRSIFMSLPKILSLMEGKNERLTT